MAYPDPVALPAIANAITRSYLPHLTTRQITDLLQTPDVTRRTDRRLRPGPCIPPAVGSRTQPATTTPHHATAPAPGRPRTSAVSRAARTLSLIHISEPTRRTPISYAV